MLSQFVPVGTIALGYLLHYAHAAPGPVPMPASLLDKRFNTFIGCKGKHAIKARQAIADMGNLTLHAYSEASTDKYG